MSEDHSSVPKDDFAFLREEIRHEDMMLNQRIMWLVSSQSFLLTGFAIALNGPLQVRFVRYEHLAVALVSWIPVVGVTISLICQITILAGLLHMWHIRRLAHTFHPSNLPWVHGTSLTRWLGLAGPALTPLIFLIVWIAFLARK
jgi:hypothetical protein